MQPSLDYLESLALRAGEILRAGFGKHHQITLKGEIDLVTEVDRQSEDFLLAEIRRDFPSHRIVAEENGAIRGEDGCAWYIDPLDGTVNYAHQLPIFAVSVAYEQDGQLCLGVVYDPMRDECFSAQRGRGAWLNGKPIHVSTIDRLERSLLVTGFPYDIRRSDQTNLEYFARFTLLTQGVRRLGSAALDLCYVACGRLDGFWEPSLGAWDMAAGALIAEQAGALVTSMDGERDYFRQPYSLLAANPHLHPLMLSVLQS